MDSQLDVRAEADFGQEKASIGGHAVSHASEICGLLDRQVQCAKRCRCNIKDTQHMVNHAETHCRTLLGIPTFWAFRLVIQCPAAKQCAWQHGGYPAQASCLCDGSS